MSESREDHVLGGWLGLLIVWLTIVRPLAGLFLWNQVHASTYSDPFGAASDHDFLLKSSLMFLFVVGLGVLSVYGGLRLWRDRTPASVRSAIVILWVSAFVAVACLMTSTEFLISSRPTWWLAIQRVGSNVAVAAAWTIYLLRSRRVRRLYYQPVAGGGRA